MENINPEILELVNRFNKLVEQILEEKIYSEEEINFLLERSDKLIFNEYFLIPYEIITYRNEKTLNFDIVEFAMRRVINFMLLSTIYHKEAIIIVKINHSLTKWLERQLINLQNKLFKTNTYELNQNEIVRVLRGLADQGLIVDNNELLSMELPLLIKSTDSSIRSYLKPNRAGLPPKSKEKIKKLFNKILDNL